MIFSRAEFDALRAIVFRLNADGTPAYPGYRPHIVEAPNGDGTLDAEKRYAHVATKYLRGYQGEGAAEMGNVLVRCQVEALRVHAALGLPEAWAPDLDASALRILEYPPGATSARHTDFDLFTLVAYRDPYPGGLVRDPDPQFGFERLKWGDTISPGIHFGELYELGGFGAATPHEVHAVGAGFAEDRIPGVTDVEQFSAVYFALPRHDLVLPDGRRLGPETKPGTYLHAVYEKRRYAR